jgi:A/G-specific adenine glycosylase
VSAGELRRPLLSWYRRHRRRLPWRETRDPYAIWVSEIMLQQTRVETALRYYPRFLGRFPTVASLARATEHAVLAHWSGLGYYSRARNLRAAARLLVSRDGGCVPRDVAALRELPGIGRYTAGAIASIAFGVRAPVLDGNVARVLARLFAIDGSPRSGPFQRRVWHLAETLVPARSPGDWNQALMEIGATICTARLPSCDRCPLRGSCRARRSGNVTRYPAPARRPAVKNVRRACVVAEDEGRVLLAHRDSGRLLRGLWQFPSLEISSGQRPGSIARRLVARLGLKATKLRRDPSIRHSIMDQRIESIVFRVVVSRAAATPPGMRWFRWRELARLPLSTVELRLSQGRFAPASQLSR